MDLTRKRPGKIDLSDNQRGPLIRVSVNWRFYCNSVMTIFMKNNLKIVNVEIKHYIQHGIDLVGLGNFKACFRN